MTARDTQVSKASQDAVKARDKRQQRRFALVVGLFAVALPTILWLGPLVSTGCERYSLSHFYYSPFYGGVFIGMLAFIGTFMVAYTGDSCHETIVAKAAGFCAYGVAFLPTTDHGCLTQDAFRARAFLRFSVDKDDGDDALKLEKAADGSFVLEDVEFFRLHETELWLGLSFTDLHYLFAAALFLGLAYFCFFVFFPVQDRHRNEDNSWKKTKIVRNVIYVVCGALILLSMVMIGSEFAGAPDNQPANTEWNINRSTFWWEAIAIWAFGLSWMVKGKFLEWVIGFVVREKIVPPKL